MGVLNGLWQILDNETLEPICDFDTIVSQEIRKDSEVSNLPIEGSFASYNKVIHPFEMVIELAKSGALLEFNNVITGLEQYRHSVDLLHIITPYGVYSDMALVNFSYTLKRERAGIIIVTLGLREIKTVTPQYQKLKKSSCKNQGCADTIDRGKQQPVGESAASELFGNLFK